MEQEILHSLRAFQVGDRYAHGPDGKRKDWVDDGQFRPDAERRSGWMTDGYGEKRMSRVVGMVVRMGGEDGLWGCERQGVWSVEIVTSTWNGLVALA